VYITSINNVEQIKSRDGDLSDNARKNYAITYASSILAATTTKINIMTKPNESASHKIFQQYKLYATEIDMIVKDTMTTKIFNELQLINEFEANFQITPQSKARREELTNKLQQLMDNKIK